MREKHIKSTISKKINDWLSSIEDVDLVKTIRENVIVTGGSIVSLINNETPNDYDIYFKTKDAVLEVSQYYVDLWNKTGRTAYVLDEDNPSEEILDRYPHLALTNYKTGRVKVVVPSSGVASDKVIEEIDEVEVSEEKENYIPKFITSNAISLSDKIQIVTRFYGAASEIHENFDFTHTKAYFDYSEKYLEINREVYECVINKSLVYTGSKYPICSLFRMRKFIKRGWSINAGQILKIAFQVSKLDLEDTNVLEDQLIGVDTLYFLQLVRILKERQEKDKKFVITNSYIGSLVDKLF